MMKVLSLKQMQSITGGTTEIAAAIDPQLTEGAMTKNQKCYAYGLAFAGSVTIGCMGWAPAFGVAVGAILTGISNDCF